MAVTHCGVTAQRPALPTEKSRAPFEGLAACRGEALAIHAGAFSA